MYGADASTLTSIDRKVKTVHEDGRYNNRSVLRPSGKDLDAKEPQKGMDDFSNPSQKKKRYNSRQTANNHKRLPFAPWDTTIVTANTHIGLDKSAGERARDPDKGQQGFTHPQ